MLFIESPCSEAGYPHKERRVSALLPLLLPHVERDRVVRLRPVHQGHLRSGDRSFMTANLFVCDIYASMTPFVLWPKQLPNVLGFLFGVAQMVLYIVYKKKKNVVVEPAGIEHIVRIAELAIAPASELQAGIEENDHRKKASEGSTEGVDKAKMAAEEGAEINAV
ncbi:hypothetical protein BHE74_00011349 [Ensete ventricosum]|nr:hypothetical protein GW17_00024216 [Ensete ventricosum]RWW80305.1 hypothetical protein BHE74_00011349 [Ensete ventricosum]RZR90540.1 hypothetical protein BHM03_00018424 [Ensete ventricosum]